MVYKKIRPKTVFIDWNKTLSYSLFWSQLSDPNHKYHHYHHIVSSWLSQNNKTLINSWMRGEKNSEKICKIIAKENNLDYKIILNTLKESCESMSFCSPKIKKIVQKIKEAGIKVVVATDNMDTFPRYTIPKLKLNKLFDDFLISCELGVLKYDTKKEFIPFFDEYLKKNNLKYTEILLIDDSVEKSGIYKKLGFRINIVNSPEDLIKYLEELIKYDY